MNPQDYFDHDPDAFENDHCFDDDFMASYSKPLLIRTKRRHLPEPPYEKHCPDCGCVVTSLMRFCVNCYPQD
jgi:hypothetical protein